MKEITKVGQLCPLENFLHTKLIKLNVYEKLKINYMIKN